MSVSRRHLLKTTLALGTLASLINTSVAEEYANAEFAEPSPLGNEDWKQGTKLVLFGTQGGPIMNTNRMMTAQAVIINGKIHLVDFGYGTLRRMAEMRIPVDNLQNLYLTHHHSDHMMDLPAIMNVTWASGVKGPIGVYAPEPIDNVLEGAMSLFSEDYRIRGRGGRFIPIKELFIPHTIANSSQLKATSTLIYQDEEVRVSGIKVPHSEFDLALGLRFDTSTRSIVISGDTGYSPQVVTLAKGADILVHEAMYWPGIEKMLLERGKGTIPESHRQYFLNEHTTAEDAGKIAAQAGVKTLVLNHLIAGPEPVTEQEWIDSAKKHFNGEVIVGRDRLII